MVSNINRSLTSDYCVEKRQERLNENISYMIDPKSGAVSFDFSYLKKNRIQGQFTNSLQGDHTTAYSLIVSSLEKRLSGKTIMELLSHIAYDRTKPTHPTIHNDLLILFHLYAKIAGHGSHFYLRDKLQNVHNSYKKLVSVIYDETNPNITGTNPDKFLKHVIDYLYNYLVCLQFFPFSAVYVEPGEGSGGRGESSALRFLKNLEHRNSFSEEEVIGFFSKLFDERAINTLISGFTHGNMEIIAFQLMGFLSCLEGYPGAKKVFFENGNIAVSKAKLKNIGYVLFCYWKKGSGQSVNPLAYDQEKDVLIKNALELIARLRSKLFHYDFLQ